MPQNFVGISNWLISAQVVISCVYENNSETWMRIDKFDLQFGQWEPSYPSTKAPGLLVLHIGAYFYWRGKINGKEYENEFKDDVCKPFWSSRCCPVLSMEVYEVTIFFNFWFFISIVLHLWKNYNRAARACAFTQTRRKNLKINNLQMLSLFGKIRSAASCKLYRLTANWMKKIV